MSECESCKNKKNLPCPNTCVYMGTCDGWEPKPTTNGDLLRAMSDEELANAKIICPYTAENMDMCEKWIVSGDTRDCAACALDWLKQEAKG